MRFLENPNLPVEFVLYNLPVDDRLAAPVLLVPPFFERTIERP